MKWEELLSEIARYAADKKAGDLFELDLRGVLGYTDYFVVCTGNTERQTKAIRMTASWRNLGSMSTSSSRGGSRA